MRKGKEYYKQAKQYQGIYYNTGMQASSMHFHNYGYAGISAKNKKD